MPAPNAWPRGSPQTCLRLTGTLWILVGVVLLTVGTIWTIQAGGDVTAWLLLPALVAGVLKSEWILRRVSRRIAARAHRRGADQWLGGCMPLKLWGAIAVMIVTGNLLRRFIIPRDVAGLIYLAVGLALILGARFVWAASSAPAAVLDLPPADRAQTPARSRP